MNKSLWAASLTLVLALSAADAAVIYLKDGSQVRGTIVSATAQDIQISTSSGLQTVRSERILRIDYADSGAALEPQATPVPPQAPSVQSRIYRRAPVDGQSNWPSGREQLFSLGFGAAAPMSEVNFESTGGNRATNGTAGLHFSSQYIVRLNPRWGAGLEFNYLGRGERFTQSLLPASDTRILGGSLMFVPLLKYSLLERGHARPYIAGGVGWHRTSLVVDAQPNLGFVWSDTNTDEVRTLVDDARWGLATLARVGIDFSFMDPSMIGFEVGWAHMENTPFSPTRAGQDVGLAPLSSVLNAMTVTLRWGWRF